MFFRVGMVPACAWSAKTPAAHQLLLCSVSRSQFHTEQANVLHNSNEQKLMSYCSSLGGGLFKTLVTGVLAVMLPGRHADAPQGQNPSLLVNRRGRSMFPEEIAEGEDL